MNRNLRRGLVFARSLLIAALVAVVFWTLVLMIFEEKFIFFPTVYPDGAYGAEAHALQPEDHWFTTADGLKLHAWLVRARKPIATILYFHGNAGNLSQRGEILRRLQQSGFNVMIFDYRGYGRSEGSPTEDGVYEDAVAAGKYLRGLTGIDSSRIVYFGSSLGGAVAVDLATRIAPAALIVESTFSSAKDVAAIAYPLLPARFFIRSEFDSESKIRSIHLPLLFAHGTMDEIIPIDLGKKLFAAANPPKEFFEIPDAHHNDIFFIGAQSYVDRIRSFVLDALRKRS